MCEAKRNQPNLSVENLYQVLERLVSAGDVRREQSVLVVCGGRFDQAVLDELGFHEVMITSLSLPDGVDPGRFRIADAERLDFPDNSYDVVLVHAGLLHCASPHRALAEMHRVARHVVLVLENQDSLLVRLLCELGLSQNYELDAVAQHDGERGGVRDSATPNYVCRWTRREIDKLLRSLDAAHEPDYRITTRIHLNEWQLHGRLGAHPLVRPFPRRAFLALARAALGVLGALLGQQGNLLALTIFKSRAKLHPWMRDGAGATGAH